MSARGRLRSSRAGDQGGALNLIHRNKPSNPALARVSSRFDFPDGVGFEVLEQALKLPFPLAVELLKRRAS